MKSNGRLYLKISIPLMVLLPLTSMAQWTLSIEDNFNSSADYVPLLPFTYNSGSCKFDFDVFANGIETLAIDNTDGCSNTPYFVLDGYKYSFTDDFTIEYDITYVDVPSGINLNNCQRLSGGPITNNSPYLIVNLTFFQLNANFDHHVKHVGDETHFVFETSNQDVICSGAIAVDLIHYGGFE